MKGCLAIQTAALNALLYDVAQSVQITKLNKPSPDPLHVNWIEMKRSSGSTLGYGNKIHPHRGGVNRFRRRRSRSSLKSVPFCNGTRSGIARTRVLRWCICQQRICILSYQIVTTPLCCEVRDTVLQFATIYSSYVLDEESTPSLDWLLHQIKTLQISKEHGQESWSLKVRSKDNKKILLLVESVQKLPDNMNFYAKQSLDIDSMRLFLYKNISSSGDSFLQNSKSDIIKIWVGEGLLNQLRLRNHESISSNDTKNADDEIAILVQKFKIIALREKEHDQNSANLKLLSFK